MSGATSFDLSAIRTDATSYAAAFRELIGIDLLALASVDYVDAAIDEIELTPGPQGPAGANGPNSISGSTATVFLGLLYGSGSNVAVASSANVITTIGFSPANQAGDTFTGKVRLISAGAAPAWDATTPLQISGAMQGLPSVKLFGPSIDNNWSGGIDFAASNGTVHSTVRSSNSGFLLGGNVGLGAWSTGQRLYVDGAIAATGPISSTSGFSNIYWAAIGTFSGTPAESAHDLNIGDFGLSSRGVITCRRLGASVAYGNRAFDFAGWGWVQLNASNDLAFATFTAGEQLRLLQGGGVVASYATRSGVFTVGTLPSASANVGFAAVVTDSSVTTNGSPVVGGGANRVMVFSNGSTWDVMVA